MQEGSNSKARGEHGILNFEEDNQLDLQDSYSDEENDDEEYQQDPYDIALDTNSSLSRNYNYVNRKRKISSFKDLRSQWISSLESTTEPKLKKMSCCRKKCFRNVNYDYYMERCKYVNSSSALVRKTILLSMLNSNKNFVFNGDEVCVRFMKQAFHFSTEFLARIRIQNENCERNDSQFSGNQRTCTISSSASAQSRGLHRPSPQKDAILSFLLRLGEDCSERMPDANEQHLPFFQKRDVYELFVNEYKRLYTDPVPTSHYFLLIWKQNCSYIKVRKVSRFTICDTCEEIRAAMREALLKGRDMDQLVSRRAAHLKIICDERMEYQKKRDRARLNPSEFCSIIVDGADQSAYGLPHFITKTKDQKGHALQLKLIGLLEHAVHNILHMYTMTEDHDTGSNHIVECIHRFLNHRRSMGPLPRKFFVQLDLSLIHI